MKQLFSFLLTVSQLSTSHILADTLVLDGGRSVTGTILQTNGTSFLVMTDYGPVSYPKLSVKEVGIEQVEAVDFFSTNRIPDCKNLILLLSKQPWASNLKQIPATVIDQGILKNVPYQSFRFGEDYEINIYGDPGSPAGIEIGVYRELLDSDSAKHNCIVLVHDLLGQSKDKDVVQQLKLTKDLQTSNGLTFEITPPSAEDAYGGWWISVYSEHELDLARATDEELKQISIAKKNVASQESQDPSAWTSEDLKFARPEPIRISFTTSSGLSVTNAEVKPYVPGVSLIWRGESSSGGIVKLADLPEELRARFGYDAAKAASADAAEAQRKARDAQARAQVATAQPTPSQTLGEYTAWSRSYIPGGSSPTYSSGGSVYVRGYYRKDGTYVHSYTRRR